MGFSKQAVSFTIRVDLLNWLDNKVKASKSNRSRMVERALELYREQETKEKLVDSFKRMRDDEEVKELSEMGLEDFLGLDDETD